MTPDRVKILCTRCKNPFRVRVGDCRDGHQAQCPSCYRMITFDSGSEDVGVKRAMTEARRIRTGYVPPQADGQERL